MGSASASESKGVIRSPILEGCGLPGGADGKRRAMDEATLPPYRDGPLLVRGPFRLLDQDGNEIELGGRETTTALCRCGKSRLRPFCDGTPNVIRFRAPSAAENGRG